MNRERINQIARTAISATIIAGGAWVYSEIRPLAYTSAEATLSQPDAAYDAILRGTLEGYGQTSELAPPARPAEKLRASIRRLPAREPILYVSSRQNPGDLALRLIIGAMGWPRPVYTPSCGEAATGDLPPGDLQTAAAVYYHTVPPAVHTKQERVLPELTFIQSLERYEWKLYCPR